MWVTNWEALDRRLALRLRPHPSVALSRGKMEIRTDCRDMTPPLAPIRSRLGIGRGVTTKRSRQNDDRSRQHGDHDDGMVGVTAVFSRRDLNTPEKRQQRLLAGVVQRHEPIARRLALSHVRHNRFGNREGPAVVEELATLGELP